MSVSKVNFNDNNEAYIVINPMSEIDKKQFKRFLDIEDDAFLPCEFEKDKSFVLYYTFGNKITLKEFLTKELSKNDALDFLKSLTYVFVQAEQYNLVADHVLLGVQSVFYDEDAKQVSCIYVPVNDGILPKRPLRLFTKEILVNMVYNEDENMEWLGNVIRYLGHHRELSYKDFYDFLELQQNIVKETAEISSEILETLTEEVSENSVLMPVESFKEEITEAPEIENPIREEVSLDDDLNLEMIQKAFESLDEKKEDEAVVEYHSAILLRKMNRIEYRIDKEEIFIGKAPDNDICISDNPIISRIHAFIIRDEGKYYIQDNGSTNHTIVNGILVRPNTKKELYSGDRILLGNEEFVFKM